MKTNGVRIFLFVLLMACGSAWSKMQVWPEEKIDCSGYLAMPPAEDPEYSIKKSLNDKITYIHLPTAKLSDGPDKIGEVTSKWDHYDETGNKDGVSQRVEVARIVHVDDPKVQRLINFVHQNNGEVRQVGGRTLYGNEKVEWFKEWPSLWVNHSMPQLSSYLKPVIAIDLTRPRALSAFKHEMVHFRSYIGFLKMFLQQGMGLLQATKLAEAKIFEPEFVIEDEHRALEEELETERTMQNHPFNRSWDNPRPFLFWHKDYVNRITYPEFQGIRSLMRLKDDEMTKGEIARLNKNIVKMVKVALMTRRRALDYLKILGKSNGDPLVSYWHDTSVTDLLLRPFGGDRLEQDKTFAEFKRRVYELCLGYIRDSNFSSATPVDMPACG